MDNLEIIKATHIWVMRHGMQKMPEDIVEWFYSLEEKDRRWTCYDDRIALADNVLDYSDKDSKDELSLLDAYSEEDHTEDSENSQELALGLMEEREKAQTITNRSGNEITTPINVFLPLLN